MPQRSNIVVRGPGRPSREEVYERLDAARTVFAALSLVLAEPSTGAHPGADPAEELRGQIAQIVRGFLATLPSTIENY